MAIKKGDRAGFEETSWQGVGDHILDLVRSIDSLLATIQGRFERNNRHLALFRLGRRALHEVRRVGGHTEAENSELAWSVRNLHEIDLTLRYVLQDPTALDHWLCQKPQDEKEILEGFLVLQDKMSAPAAEGFRKQLDALNTVCAELNVSMQKPWRMDHLAKAAGREIEYRNLYKFYSKFVHPTSWLVNTSAERIDSVWYRNLLLGLTQVLARRIYGLIYDSFSLTEADVIPGTESADWQQAS